MQRSFGLMALDIASKQQQQQAQTLLVSSPEQNSPISSPCSPVSRLETYNPILRLKDLGENATQLLGIQHHESIHSITKKLSSPVSPMQNQIITNKSTGSPSSSISSTSPQASPNQANSIASVSPQQNSHLIPNIYSISSISGQVNGENLLSPSAIKSLKFSIENILKPEFGRNGKEKRSYQSSSASSSPAQNHINSATHISSANTPTSKSSSTSSSQVNTSGPTGNKVKKNNSFDISSLTGKRKHSSDSECSTTSSFSTTSKDSSNQKKGDNSLWPAWVYCTRYSDRPSSGPRSRRMKKKEKKSEEKRPRTAFTADQLARLKQEFQENRYLTERRRQDLARDLKLNESQIKIWFQNKRAKIKKTTGSRNPLALHLMAQGLYNHSTMPVGEDCDNDDDDDDEMIVDDERKGSNGSSSSPSSSESNKNL